ncbi:MAG: glycosyltransferase [Candidatus Thorarchaeota archaeon]
MDVANKLIKDYDNILFIIAGTGPLEKKLKIETKNEDRIKILGYRNDVPQILALSNIYAQPSYSEGLSPAILEACSYGLPIVSTYVGANPDLIINGINGFLIRPGDKIKLQKFLSILIDNRDLRVKMGKINKDLIKNNYDLKKTVKKFLSVLRKTTYTYYF